MARPYSTIEELRAVYGDNTVSTLLQDRAAGDVADNLLRYSIARASADAKIDQSLIARYSLPLETNPDEIVEASYRIIFYNLSKGRPVMDEVVLDNFNEQVELLQQIKDGERHLSTQTSANEVISVRSTTRNKVPALGTATLKDM